MSVIIGLDPGSRFLGFGAIRIEGDEIAHVDHGVITVPSDLSFARKLDFIAGALGPVLRSLAPSAAVVERIFLGKNADSAFKLGHVRGVCLQLAAGAGTEVYEYAARSVKKTVTGSGAASKEHVATVVTQLLRLRQVIAVDASDALAMAICHSREIEFNRKMQRQMEYL